MDRLELQSLLEGILGSRFVYFQPPPTMVINYPCIVYHRDSAITEFAGNVPYHYSQRYQVTYISENPDSEILGKVASLPMCTFNRWFPANNLNHDVFNLYA